MKYVVLEYVCMCLPCITLFFYVFARFSTKQKPRQTIISLFHGPFFVTRKLMPHLARLLQRLQEPFGAVLCQTG